MSGWGCFEFHDTVHVMPFNDNEGHYFLDCECKPKYENGVYVHNSFDSREMLEQMEVDGVA